MKDRLDYFVDKFSAIPDSLWTTKELTKGDKHCALGHCGERLINGRISYTNEGMNLRELFCLYKLDVTLVNDNREPKFRQRKPKQRILKALEYMSFIK